MDTQVGGSVVVATGIVALVEFLKRVNAKFPNLPQINGEGTILLCAVLGAVAGGRAKPLRISRRPAFVSQNTVTLVRATCKQPRANIIRFLPSFGPHTLQTVTLAQTY